jgi:hypothetical protein
MALQVFKEVGKSERAYFSFTRRENLLYTEYVPIFCGGGNTDSPPGPEEEI